MLNRRLHQAAGKKPLLYSRSRFFNEADATSFFQTDYCTSSNQTSHYYSTNSDSALILDIAINAASLNAGFSCSNRTLVRRSTVPFPSIFHSISTKISAPFRTLSEGN